MYLMEITGMQCKFFQCPPATSAYIQFRWEKSFILHTGTVGSSLLYYFSFYASLTKTKD